MISGCAGASERKPEEPRAAFSAGRRIVIPGIIAVVLVFLAALATVTKQAVWEDELTPVATGWSMAHSGPPTMSVLAQYPNTGSPIRFYGPVSFEVEAFLVRNFGLSLRAWRTVCYSGIIITLLSSVGLVRLAGADEVAQVVCALAVVLTCCISVQLPGRWDYVSTGLALAGLLCFLAGALAKLAARRVALGVAGGLAFGLALGSTPRVLTFIAATLLGSAFAVATLRGLRGGILATGAVCFGTAVLAHTALMSPWGMNSLSWYSYMKATTSNDPINATPITGRGNWALNLGLHKTFLLAFLPLLLAAIWNVLRQSSRGREAAVPSIKILLAIIGLLNLALMLLLLRGSLGQVAFWAPPALVAVTSWLDGASVRLKRDRVTASLVWAGLLILAAQYAQIMAVVALTWRQRDTSGIESLVRRETPRGAAVYGPVGGYFYPVELAGDRYLYLKEQTLPGQVSEPHASLGKKLDQEGCVGPVYLLWPQSDPREPSADQMPSPLSERILPPIGEYSEPELAPWKRAVLSHFSEVAYKYGFPGVALFPMQTPSNCVSRRSIRALP